MCTTFHGKWCKTYIVMYVCMYVCIVCTEQLFVSMHVYTAFLCISIVRRIPMHYQAFFVQYTVHHALVVKYCNCAFHHGTDY